MISPELLRRYPFFAPFDDAEQKQLAMMADEIQVAEGTVLFEGGNPADYMYLLLEGGIDLYDVATDEFDSSLRKEFYVGEIDPGEILSVSAVIEPYLLTATGRTSAPSRLVRFDAAKLQDADRNDPVFGCKLMHQIVRAVMDRLTETRTLLAGMQP